MTTERQAHRAKHHPAADWLVAYAAGTLGEAESLLIASHATLCPPCRAGVANAEAIGGLMLAGAEGGPSMPMPTPSGDDAAPPAAAMKGDGVLPAPLRTFLGDNAALAPWRWLARGVERADIVTRGLGRAFLLRVQPGVAVPEHTHGGTELTLLLRGSYTDALGTFARGDMADVDAEVAHQPRADEGEACVCLVALSAPLRFRRLVPRILQPLLRL
jgi:putative transcriptional regulator